jgi:hypothetical protein
MRKAATFENRESFEGNDPKDRVVEEKIILERINVVFIIADDLGYGDIGYTTEESPKRSISTVWR